MQWEDQGFLLSKNRYSENSVIAEFFTKNHGKASGMIFGATSKKIKNYLQLGNKFYINFSSKNENKVGYFKVEIEQVLTPKYFDDQKKLSCVISSMNLIKLLTVESQSNLNIFNLIEKYFIILNEDNWLNNFIFWELEFLKLIGYDLEIKNFVNEEIIDGKKMYFVISSNDKKIVPNFLVESNINEDNKKNIIEGLKLVSDYLEKSILKPNNIAFPRARDEFLNLIKNK
jgi:DNA repair protein RecO (recombination protein O)